MVAWTLNEVISDEDVRDTPDTLKLFSPRSEGWSLVAFGGYAGADRAMPAAEIIPSPWKLLGCGFPWRIWLQ